VAAGGDQRQEQSGGENRREQHVRGRCPTAQGEGQGDVQVGRRAAAGNVSFRDGRELAQRLRYPAAQLDRLPVQAIESFAGVGYHLGLAALAPDEQVLDMGSGSGMDAFLAWLSVSPGGQVIGIDMTEEQLAKARRLAADAGFAGAGFEKAYMRRCRWRPARSMWSSATGSST
jgi:2-polyprenyl-3-methyl-5-hydroxy-6-metoxy-1,4-benzoquinol methylase